MALLDNIITYTGAGVIIYFLIRAFGGESIGNVNSVMLTVGIMIIIIFLLRKCKTESFRTVSNPLKMDGLSPQWVARPTEEAFFHSSGKNGMVIDGKFRPFQYQPTIGQKFDYGTTDKDIIDQMNISKVDKQKFEETMISEKLAKEDIKSRWRNEMIYSDSNPFNTLPIGRELNSYTYLPEYAWFRGYEKPPVCVPSGRECPVCPLSSGGTTELMHFSNVDSYAGRAPEGINLEYTEKVLNQGIKRCVK